MKESPSNSPKNLYKKQLIKIFEKGCGEKIFIKVFPRKKRIKIMAKRRRITRYHERIGPDLTPGMMTLTVFLATAVILSVYFAFNAEPRKRTEDTYVNTWDPGSVTTEPPAPEY